MTQINKEKELLKELYEHVKSEKISYERESKDNMKSLQYCAFYRGLTQLCSSVLKIFEKHNYKPENTNE
jgi:hypothetical protein